MHWPFLLVGKERNKQSPPTPSPPLTTTTTTTTKTTTTTTTTPHLAILVALERPPAEPLHVPEPGGELEEHPHPGQAQAIPRNTLQGLHVGGDLQAASSGDSYLGGDVEKRDMSSARLAAAWTMMQHGGSGGGARYFFGGLGGRGTGVRSCPRSYYCRGLVQDSSSGARLCDSHTCQKRQDGGLLP